MLGKCVWFSRVYKEVFWAWALFLDLDAGYISVFILWKSRKLCTYDMYIFLYVNYTSETI